MYGHQQPYAPPHQAAYPAAAAYPPAAYQQGYPSPYGAPSPQATNAGATPTSAPEQALPDVSWGQTGAQVGQGEGEQQRRKRFREFKEEKQVAGCALMCVDVPLQVALLCPAAAAMEH